MIYGAAAARRSRHVPQASVRGLPDCDELSVVRERRKGRLVRTRHPRLAAEPDDLLEQRGAPRARRDGRRSRRAAGSARTAPWRCLTSSACASTRPTRRAFCSPVEQSVRRHALGAMRDDEIAAVRALQGAAGRAVALAARRAAPPRSRPRPRRPGAASGRARACLRASDAPRGTASRARARGARRWWPRGATASARAAAIATPVSAMTLSSPSKRASSKHAVLEQAVALAHGALEMADARAVAGIEAQDQPVEKAAALGGRAGEQAIHGRRQPDHLDVVGRARLSRTASSPSMRTTRPRARSPPGRQARADLDGTARRRVHARGDRPEPSPPRRASSR